MGCSARALPHLPVAARFDDIDLPSAVKYLIASDPNLQVLGAAYLQHKCYSDGNAKKQVSPPEPWPGTPARAEEMEGASPSGWGAAGCLNRAGLSAPRPAASRPCPSW